MAARYEWDSEKGNVVLRPMRYGWPAACSECRGVGLVGGPGDLRSCPTCKGTGLPVETERA